MNVLFFVFLHPVMEAIVRQTVEALRRGATILYPTDTIWGLGCDARNRDAVERLYAIKERDHSKSMLVLVPALPPLPALEASATDRPTTYILPSTVWQPALGCDLADNLAADDGSLGLRAPRHEFCQAVMRLLGAPLVSTSANLSGRPSPARYEDIDPELMRRVDYCVPPRPELLSAESSGSRILKLLADGQWLTLRP